MSLTQVIKYNAHFRQAVKQMTVRPPAALDCEQMVEPRTKQYMLVGTAFDYLVGFELQRLNQKVLKGHCELVADKSLAILRRDAKDALSNKVLENTEGRLSQFKVHAQDYLIDGILTPEFAASLLEIAQLDQIYRSGHYPRLPLPRASKGNVADIMALHEIMPTDALKASHCAYIGPDFGYASQLVGGADADFVVDGALLDTKTTMKASIPLSMWCQVVGYYLLNHIQKQVGAPFIEIDRLGIYFARFGQICQISVKDSIPDPEVLALILMGHDLKI